MYYRIRQYVYSCNSRLWCATAVNISCALWLRKRFHHYQHNSHSASYDWRQTGKAILSSASELVLTNKIRDSTLSQGREPKLESSRGTWDELVQDGSAFASRHANAPWSTKRSTDSRFCSSTTMACCSATGTSFERGSELGGS